nr:ATP-binding cassette domain-containing protein [uncultured Cohaesibacter sp.]
MTTTQTNRMPQEPMMLEEVKIRLAGDCLIHLSLSVAAGEVVTIMGPSGSGKSTLLAYIGGFLPPAFEGAGRVWLDGQDVSSLPAERRHIGILFQDPLLFPHLSVGGNLAFGLTRDVKGRAARKARVCEALEAINMAGFEGRDPETLSGGQKARVALARTLLSQPRALLLDEPFSKLDADLRVRMRHHVFERARSEGLPTLLVTHDEADARAAQGRIIRLAPNGIVG